MYLDGDGSIAYALLRPPGHHAQPQMADGYCFFNNIGVAIEALRARGLKRAAVIDWDVHHGNGTQQGFYDDADVLTVSLHMNHGAWGVTHPQTGDVDEVGRASGLGKNLNLPMPYGSGDAAYLRVYSMKSSRRRCVRIAPTYCLLPTARTPTSSIPTAANC